MQNPAVKKSRSHKARLLQTPKFVRRKYVLCPEYSVKFENGFCAIHSGAGRELNGWRGISRLKGQNSRIISLYKYEKITFNPLDIIDNNSK